MKTKKAVSTGPVRNKGRVQRICDAIEATGQITEEILLAENSQRLISIIFAVTGFGQIESVYVIVTELRRRHDLDVLCVSRGKAYQRGVDTARSGNMVHCR